MKNFLFKLFLCSPLSTPYSLLLYAYPPGWSDDILISPDSGGYRYNPDISCDSYNNVWVCWDSANWTNGYIFYTKLDSLGNCLVPETRVSTSTLSRFGRIAVDEADNIHFVWRELSPIGYGLGYAKLRNDGAVIVSAHLVVNGADGGNPLQFEMALDRQKNLHVVWGECPVETDWINYTLLDSMGNTLIARVVFSDTTDTTNSMCAVISVDSLGNNHIAHCKLDAGNWLTYTKIDRSGNVVVSETVLDHGSTFAILCDNAQNVHIFFLNPEGVGNHIFYIKLDNNGNVLIPSMRVSLPTPWSSFQPHAALDSQQNIHVVWEGDSAQQFSNLFYTKMDTAGNFLVPPMQIVFPPYTWGVITPRIAVDNSDKLHISWVDGRLDSVPRIFYKRGANETTVRESNQSQNVIQNALRAYPNPFSNETRITFSDDAIKQSTSCYDEARGVELKIYDISGRQVKSFDKQKFAGSIIWQGTGDHNVKLPNGIYFIRFTWKTGQQTMPITKIN